MAADFQKSLRYPLGDPDVKKKLLIGGACYFPGMLVIVGPLFIAGYAISALRKVIKGEEDRLPEWELMADHFRFGLMSLVINLVYGLIPGSIMVLSLVPAIGMIFSTRANESGLAGFSLIMIVGISLGILLSLIVAAVLPMAYLNYATTDELARSFAIGQIIERITSHLKEYGIVFAYCLLVSVGASILSSFVQWVPVLGWFAAGVCFTYSTLVCAHLVGTFYRENFGTDVKASQLLTEGMGMSPDQWTEQ